jgi:hypothetical protein
MILLQGSRGDAESGERGEKGVGPCLLIFKDISGGNQHHRDHREHREIWRKTKKILTFLWPKAKNPFLCDAL